MSTQTTIGLKTVGLVMFYDVTDMTKILSRYVWELTLAKAPDIIKLTRRGR